MHKNKSVSVGVFGAWVMIAASFVLLGVNKQLDLQSAFTELGRVLLYRPDRIDYKYDVKLFSSLPCRCSQQSAPLRCSL